MHNDFADWYRICTTGTETNLTGDLLAKRWEAIEKVANDCDGNALDLVRITLQRPGVTPGYLDKFKNPFKEVDTTFQMSGNDLEISVLAGSALCQILSTGAEEADEAAIGMLCGASIARGSSSAGPFIARAGAYLDGRLHHLRKPAVVPQPSLPTKKLRQHFDAVATKLNENQPAQTSEAAKQMFEVLLQAMTTANEAAVAAIDELKTQSRFRREETDVLWWLTAGISRDTAVNFKKLKAAAASIIAGKELADLVSPPGILPAKSILQSVIPPAAGKSPGKISIREAVNSTDTQWRQSVVGSVQIDKIVDLCPLLAAVKYSLTTDEADGWALSYKKAYGVDADTSLRPLDLSHMIYRECLLARIEAGEQ